MIEGTEELSRIRALEFEYGVLHHIEFCSCLFIDRRSRFPYSRENGGQYAYLEVIRGLQCSRPVLNARSR